MNRTSQVYASAGSPHIEPFVYAEDAEPDTPGSDQDRSEERIEETFPEPADLQRLLEEAKTVACADGHEKGVEEGRKLERAAWAAELAESNARVEHALEAFDVAREQIVQQFEPSVVRLALAIAARILRREARTDPLLLSGAVRVALGQLAASAEVRLRVPAAEEALWAEWTAMLPNVRARLMIEAGEGMRLGDCVVETDLGSADLGVRAQLGEIDRAFFEGRVEAKNL
jgi:flagellar assembly protein FliH